MIKIIYNNIYNRIASKFLTTSNIVDNNLDNNSFVFTIDKGIFGDKNNLKIIH